ncbi:hypothetical protein O4H52_15765 [Sphingomonadaceae bacterium G21617-S1]|nr:hypothetical protein [Sphingomonadaceae bacterium G21617-S1]
MKSEIIILTFSAAAFGWDGTVVTMTLTPFVSGGNAAGAGFSAGTALRTAGGETLSTTEATVGSTGWTAFTGSALAMTGSTTAGAGAGSTLATTGAALIGAVLTGSALAGAAFVTTGSGFATGAALAATGTGGIAEAGSDRFGVAAAWAFTGLAGTAAFTTAFAVVADLPLIGRLSAIESKPIIDVAPHNIRF